MKVILYSTLAWGLAMGVVVFAYVGLQLALDPGLIAILQIPVAGVIAGIHKSVNWQAAGIAAPPIVTPPGADQLSSVMGGVSTIEGGPSV